MNLKIKERRSLGHEIKCMCDETFASEECCGWAFDEILMLALIDRGGPTCRMHYLFQAAAVESFSLMIYMISNCCCWKSWWEKHSSTDETRSTMKESCLRPSQRSRAVLNIFYWPRLPYDLHAVEYQAIDYLPAITQRCKNGKVRRITQATCIETRRRRSLRILTGQYPWCESREMVLATFRGVLYAVDVPSMLILKMTDGSLQCVTRIYSKAWEIHVAIGVCSPSPRLWRWIDRFQYDMVNRCCSHLHFILRRRKM